MGNYPALIEGLQYTGAEELLIFFGPTTDSVPPDSYARRMSLHKYPLTLSQIIQACGIYHMTEDMTCIQRVVAILVEQHRFCTAKLLAYQIKDDDLQESISKQYALYCLQKRHTTTAALELLSADLMDEAMEALSLSGETLLAYVCALFGREHTCGMGLVGAAELAYRNRTSAQLIMSLSGGSGSVSQGVYRCLSPYISG